MDVRATKRAVTAFFYEWELCVIGARKNRKVKPEPQSWYRDRYQHVLVQRKLLSLFTILSLGATLVMAVVMTQLIPLKSIEPYVIQIDAKSGRTEMVDPLSASELTTNQVVNNYFLVQYLRAREGYSSADILYNYNLVRLMSDANVYREFSQWADPNNASSNMARLGMLGMRSVKIKSITYISPKVAQIRLMISETNKTPQAIEYNRIVLINFEYAKMTLSTEERYANPLGFHVTMYQINEDVPS